MSLTTVHAGGCCARWAAEHPPLRNGDCGYGVVPEEWHHGVAGPPMTDTPADRCER